MNLADNVLESLSRILRENRSIELGRPLELADAFFAFRLLLGRNPSDAELSHFGQIAGQIKVREFLDGILASDEYQRQTRFFPPGYELISDLNGYLFRFRTGDREMGVPMALGIYEPVVTRIVRSVAPRCRTMVDCGANTGYFTCTFLDASSEDAKVIAFEPMPECNEMFRKNVEMNPFRDRVTLYPAACGSEPGELTMSAVSNMLIGCSVEGARERTIEVVRLDDVVEEKVDLVKLDVEGSEPAAVEGMERILRESRPLLITELNEYWLRHVSGKTSREYVAQIESVGYRVVPAEAYAEGKTADVGMPEDDSLFVTEVVCVPRD